MKRQTVAVACLVGAVIALVVGLVFKNQADFSRNYVHDQLAEHGITFTPVANLLPPQQKIPCLIANAGKPLTSGKQAECYARYQIGIDLTFVAGGATYFQAHYNGYLGRVAAQAEAEKDPNSAAAVQAQKDSVKADQISNDLLAGEATKGLLLTAYGFSIMGDRLNLTAVVLLILSAVLLVLAIALFVLREPRKSAPLAATTE